MKKQHTPGPWKYELQKIEKEFDKNGNEISSVTKDDYFTINAGDGFYRFSEDCNGFGITGYISEANARLIAAAPELLKALEMFVRKFAQSHSVPTNYPHYRDAVHAIYKAKGE